MTINKPPSETAYRGVDKVERYGWQMTGQPGQFAMIPKLSIRVDHTYQRPLNDAKRLRIASAFHWVSFGALSISRRPDGSLWVIEGQHRLWAALARSDITHVPCLVFEVGSVTEEARWFLECNVDRAMPRGHETFRASVTANDSVAISVRDLVELAGRTVGSGSDGKTVNCVRALQRCMKDDEAALRSVWPIIVQLCEGQTIDQRVVIGMHHLEVRLTGPDGEKRSLSESDNSQKLLTAGRQAILRSIAEASAFYSRGGAAVWANAILAVVNHKRRKLLTFKGAA